MPDSKGMHDLRLLLSQPGLDVPVRTLAKTAEPGVTRADNVLDAEAKAAYRRRLEELSMQIEDSLAVHDDSCAAALDRERTQLIEELWRATRLGGRSRASTMTWNVRTKQSVPGSVTPCGIWNRVIRSWRSTCAKASLRATPAATHPKTRSLGCCDRRWTPSTRPSPQAKTGNIARSRDSAFFIALLLWAP